MLDEGHFRAVPESNRWLFAAACAERTAPVFRFFSATRSRSPFDAALEDLWHVEDGGVLRVHLERLDELNEAKPIRSPTSRLYATHALGVLVEALGIRAGDTSEGALGRVSMTALDVYANLDSVLRPDFPKPRVINPRNPPVGRLESEEVSIQLAHLTALVRGEGEAGSTRQGAQERASQLEFLLAHVQKKRKDAGLK